MSFIYNYPHFEYTFCNQSVLFAQLKNVNRLWNNNWAYRACKRAKSSHKTNSRLIQIDHMFYCSICASNRMVSSAINNKFDEW